MLHNTRREENWNTVQVCIYILLPFSITSLSISFHVGKMIRHTIILPWYMVPTNIKRFLEHATNFHVTIRNACAKIAYFDLSWTIFVQRILYREKDIGSFPSANHPYFWPFSTACPRIKYLNLVESYFLYYDGISTLHTFNDSSSAEQYYPAPLFMRKQL